LCLARLVLVLPVHLGLVRLGLVRLGPAWPGRAHGS